MSRKPIIAGNWKMHNNVAESVELTKGIIDGIKGLDSNKLPEIVIAPVFTSLYPVSCELKGNKEISLSSQNCYFEPKGAFTGEISIDMLKDISCKYS